MKIVKDIIPFEVGCYIIYNDQSYDRLEGITVKDMYKMKGKKVKTFEEIINERLNILNQKGDDLVNVRC